MFVIRLGVAWVLSLVAAAVGLEIAHRIVLATGHDVAETAADSASAVSVRER